MQITGRIVEILPGIAGSFLEADTLAGVQTLEVSFSGDFAEEGGQVIINGVVYSYDAISSDPDTIHITAPLATDLEGGTPVELYPDASETLAMVAPDDLDSSVELAEAVMEHSYKTMFQPQRWESGTGPQVTLDDTYGRWYVVQVHGFTAQINAEDVLGTIPEESMSDGIPPAASPVPTLKPFAIGGIRWTIVALENRDPQKYRVFAGPTGFTPDSSNLVYEGSSLTGSFDKIGDVSLLPEDPLGVIPEYVVRVEASDADGPAEAGIGAESLPSSPKRATNQEISSEYGYFGEISVTQLVAGIMEASIILAADIMTGSSGARAGLSATDGIVSFDPNGEPVFSVPIIPDETGHIAAFLRAALTATSLTVEDFLALRGVNNEFSKGSITTLATGTTAPQSPPQPSIGWTNKPLTFGTGLSLNGTGFAVDGSNFWQLTSLFGGEMQRFVEDTGSYNSVPGASYNLGSWMQPTGITVLGAYVYVIGRDTRENVGGFGKFYVWKYDKTNGSYVSRWQYQPSGSDTGLYSNFDPALGNNGTNLLISQCRNSNTGDKSVWIRTYNTAGALQSTLQTDHLPGDHQVSILYGNFDYGSARYIMTSRSSRITAYACLTTGARSPNDDFILPKPSWGQVWDGGVFKTSTVDGVCIHSSINWANPAVDRWWVAHSWFDSNPTGGLHETLISKKVSFLMKKRANLTVTSPPLPANTGGTDDVTGVRIYHGNGASEPTAANMKRGTVDLANLATTITYTSNPPLVTSANTGTPGPFPASTPARFQSTEGGLWFNGKGEGEWPLMGQIWGSITRTSVQSLTQAAETPIVFTSGDVSAAVLSGGVTATTAGLVVPAPGLYTVTPIASFAAAGATGSRIIVFKVNGATRASFGLPLHAGPSGYPVSTPLQLDTGDVVSYTLYQSSGAAINTHNQSYPGIKLVRG